MFVTAGNVLGNFDYNRHRTLNESVDYALHNFRLSYGIGLALKLGGIARIELNYCIPIRLVLFTNGTSPLFILDVNRSGRGSERQIQRSNQPFLRKPKLT